MIFWRKRCNQRQSKNQAQNFLTITTKEIALMPLCPDFVVLGTTTIRMSERRRTKQCTWDVKDWDIEIRSSTKVANCENTTKNTKRRRNSDQKFVVGLAWVWDSSKEKNYLRNTQGSYETFEADIDESFLILGGGDSKIVHNDKLSFKYFQALRRNFALLSGYV